MNNGGLKTTLLLKVETSEGISLTNLLKGIEFLPQTLIY